MKITKVIPVEQETAIDCKCDVCGKLAGEPYPKNWFHFSHGHSEWGNDSGDSFEVFDVCSPECFIKQLKSSLDDMEDYKRSAEIAGMYFPFAQQLYTFIVKNLNP